MNPGVASEPKPHSSLNQSAGLSLWLKGVLLASLLWWLFRDILADMARDWWVSDAYSQGMLLPPMAIYVAWLNRHTTFSFAAVPDLRGLWVTGGACLLYILGKAASEFFMTRLSFVVVIAGIIWTWWGTRRLRTLLFPVLLLATMVPLPGIVYNSLAAPLQLFASDVASRIAQAFGVSVYRDGNILQLSRLTLGVAEACSGLNSLSALMVGALILAWLMCTGIYARLLLFLAAAPVAVAVNILRVAGTALLADHKPDLATGFYHTFSGWLIFICGFGLLYLLAQLLHASLDRE